VGPDIEIDIAEVQQAQNHACHHAALAPYAAPGKQINKNQDARQRERGEQAAGECSAAFGHLLEQNIDGAVAHPYGQQIENRFAGVARPALRAWPQQQAYQGGQGHGNARHLAAREGLAEQNEGGYQRNE